MEGSTYRQSLTGNASFQRVNDMPESWWFFMKSMTAVLGTVRRIVLTPEFHSSRLRNIQDKTLLLVVLLYPPRKVSRCIMVHIISTMLE